MDKHIKKHVYICIPESLCCAAEINTTCKSTILQLNKQTNPAKTLPPYMGVLDFVHLLLSLHDTEKLE